MGGILFAGVAGAAVGLTIARLVRERGLKANRGPASDEDFAAHFSAKDVPTVILRVVYAYFQKWVSVSDFPVQPGDDIGRTYGIVGEDLTEAALQLYNRCWDASPEPGQLASARVVTVEDLVIFLAQPPFRGAAVSKVES